MYRIVAATAYDREYAALPSLIQRRVDQQIQRLREDPRHPSLHTHKRRGEEHVWQARMTGDYRLYFAMEGDTITLLTVTPHEK